MKHTRWLAIVLAMAMLLTMLPSVSAANTCGKNLKWSISSGVLRITGTGDMTDFSGDNAPWYAQRAQIKSVEIASGVTSIGSYAFFQFTAAKTISIPSTVKRIGNAAFFDCPALQSLTLPKGLEYLGGSQTFYGCSLLKELTIPGGLDTVGMWMFADCKSMTSVSLPNTVSSICEEAFRGCSVLKSLKIPKKVTYFSAAVIVDCPALATITVETGNTALVVKDGLLYNKSMTSLYACPPAKTGTVTVASGVTTIEYRAFANCKITSVSLPSSLTNIQGNAFYQCSQLTSIAIPKKVEFIGSGAFTECNKLTTVSIPASVTTILSAFTRCNALTAINVDAANKSYASKDGVLFYKDCKTLLQCPAGKKGSFAIAEGTTTVSSNSFNGCNKITSISIPASVVYIESMGLCTTSKLTEYKVSKDNKNFCAVNGALYSKDLKTLVSYPSARTDAAIIPEGTEFIERGAFCEAQSPIVVMPTSVNDWQADVFFERNSGIKRLFILNPRGNFTCEYRNNSTKITVYAAKGSNAENLAKKYKIPFVEYNCTNYYFGLDCCSYHFMDAPKSDNWAHKGIDFCLNRGLFSGTGATSFAPNDNMTRAMVVTVLYRLAGEPKGYKNTFSDVAAGKWYTDAIAWAAGEKIVSGTGSGKFSPNGNVTREQLASILFNFEKYNGGEAAERAKLTFSDASKLSSWAVEPMQWAVARELISGVASGSKVLLNPRGNATRAQVASILMRYLSEN